MRRGFDRQLEAKPAHRMDALLLGVDNIWSPSEARPAWVGL